MEINQKLWGAWTPAQNRQGERFVESWRVEMRQQFIGNIQKLES